MADTTNTRTLKIIHNGQLKHICCPANGRYKDVIEIVAKTFTIPNGFEDLIHVSNEFGYKFVEHTFDYFLSVFPHSELIFYIDVDYGKLLDIPRWINQEPLSRPNPKQLCGGKVQAFPYKGPKYLMDSTEKPKIRKVKTNAIRKNSVRRAV